ncbi:hypothetical protein JVT61DRAFT_13360 [Boletus reticuloceps]|uniref:Uncharacterized protein n=1 Tax=Boletus reticuloceps TaxID=495285 RepID=A0A8I2YDI9_9AGAM|nr:hypothetical protein JVT61DRAFT_13360 [Boletus reticuloceps]
MSATADNIFDARRYDVTLDPTALAYVNSPEFKCKCTEIALECATSSSGESSDRETFGLAQMKVTLLPPPLTSTPTNLQGSSSFFTMLDKFNAPSGPEAYTRRMRVMSFRSMMIISLVIRLIVGLLNEKDIKTSAVDFVQFKWLNQRPGQVIDDNKEEEEEEEEGDDVEDEIFDVSKYDKITAIMPIEDGDRFVSNPTVWIGVFSDSLTTTGAHDVAKGICDYLNELQLENIDIVFCEKKFKFLARPALYHPIKEGDTLQPVIDNVSVALSLSIQNFKTSMQGMLGPYFRIDKKLYAITVRHNLFPLDDNNVEYRFNPSARKKEVLVMGDIAFTNYKASIQAHICTLLDTIKSLKKRVDAYKRKVEDVVDIYQSKVILQENKVELSKTERHINQLKQFFLIIDKRWGKRKDRAIGHVIWAPPIATGQAPHNYTCNLNQVYRVEAVELDLWTRNVPSEFKFPDHSLLHLKRILTADEVKHPNSKDTQGNPIRRVLKDGYMSSLTSAKPVKLPIFNNEDEPGTFSKGGDSGSLIVNILSRFVVLLTGGLNKGTDGSDITYATLFEWVNLYFEGLVAFFTNND